MQKEHSSMIDPLSNTACSMPMITASQALQIITSIDLQPGPARMAPLAEAVGHILAEDITTPRDIPPFNRSAMDGYAVRTADLEKTPSSLQVVAVCEAGDASDLPLARGQCVKIMTGAAVPDDADAVVMIENTRSDNPTKHTTILKSPRPFENIARKGEDAPAHAVVLQHGQMLTAPALALAAGVGRPSLKVYSQPTVAILQSGSELVEPGENIAGNKIYNSNATLLTGLIADADIGISQYLGICPDDPQKLTDAVKTGLNSNVLLLTGGISKGDFDYIPQVLADCGVKHHFHGLAIKPGKPLLFGSTANGCFVFGLPGNPVSVMVCFQEFVLPLLRRLAGGRRAILPANIHVTLTASLKKKPGRLFYCCACLTCRHGQWFAEPIPGHGSGDYVNTARTNGVVILPEDSAGAAAGEQVTAHLWQSPLRVAEENA